MKNFHQYSFLIKKIKQLEPQMKLLKERDFLAKIKMFKFRIAKGEKTNSLLPEVYALMKEVIRRTLDISVFDVQLLGAIAVHQGKIVEMKTGEGKTITILFPAILGALEEEGVHIITANDYLAKRDAIWMEKVYKKLGISVDYITSATKEFDRQIAYASDVTYVTSNEVCFDYLKDNMLYDSKNKRQRGFNYAIVDEADSVLIDEAQIPLVISGAKSLSKKEKEVFRKINEIIKFLKKGIDFKVNKKYQTVTLTIEGVNKLESLMGVKNLYSEIGNDIYYLECLLKAHYLFSKDKDYVVENGKIIIVDDFTGRMMADHRYHQGIHQAIEAKEEIDIQDENEVLALTTFQHFFRHYKKMTGLTGTAKIAEKEFQIMYDKDVFVVPTNKPIIRQDIEDKFFLSWQDKLDRLAWETQEHFFKNKAVLIGARSVKKSHQIQRKLLEENIPSNVLNASHTAREAEVISSAGTSQTVTVATNMAGRGTDIEIDEGTRMGGGLIVYGTERHNARRIDDQLIGRSGRQGDLGQSQFFISADDELVSIFFRKEYEERIREIKNFTVGVYDEKLSEILEKAQKRMEDIFLSQRVLNFRFDDVLEKQRNDFYHQRNLVLQNENLKFLTLSLLQKQISKEIFEKLQLDKKKKIISLEVALEMKKEIEKFIDNRWFRFDFEKKEKYSIIDLKKRMYLAIENYYQDFENYYSSFEMRDFEKSATLKVMDVAWSKHLENVEKEQDSAIIKSLGGGDFFQEYQIILDVFYKKMSLSIPPVLAKTILRSINILWTK